MKAKNTFTLLCALCATLPMLAQRRATTARDSVHGMHEVVVTGTGTRHLLSNAPVQTEVITRKMLDSYGGKSVQEILSGLTASFAFNEGDMGSQMQLGGLGNAYILVLVDGKRLHGDVGGENDLGLIDPLNIERIEIVKGAQSALYGSDAMAGVINIITRKHPDEGLYAENTTRMASYGDWRQHNGIGWTWGRWTSHTKFQRQQTDGWQHTAREYTEARVVEDSRNKTVNAYTNWQLAERLTYQLNPSLQAYAEGMYYTKHINRPTDGKYPSCDVYTYNLMYRNASAAVGGEWKRPKSKDVVTLDVNWDKHAYFYDYTATTLTDGYDPNGKFTNYFPYFAGQKNLQSDQQRVLANLKGILHLPQDHTLSVGAEFRYDYLKAPMRTENGSAHDHTLALYVQDEFARLRWLHLTGGLRLIQHADFGFHATPKLSAMIPLGDVRLRLGWSQGFKTPTTKELHYRYLHVMGGSTFYNLGNRGLKAQTNNYWSTGVEYRNKAFSVSVTGYLNDLNHLIALVNVPISELPAGLSSAYLGDGSDKVVVRKYLNMEDARTHGVDVNATLQLGSDWRVTANYSYLNTTAHQYNSAHDRMERVTLDGMAHHKWNAHVQWQRRLASVYQLGISLNTNGSSKRYYQNNGDGRAFQLWRINTTHDFGRANRAMSYRLEVGLDNLFDYRDRTMHPYHLGTTHVGRNVFATFSVRFRQGKRLGQSALRSTRDSEGETE